jgi:N-acetylmuramoyl-L-alanine amidase-like protein
MPKPFIALTLKQFADLLHQFPWRRQITEVHVHHTFKPNHADFAARPPIQAIEGMFRFHTEERKFSDIAQHITIDPRGIIWTGRNWNQPPASATGFNGNANRGPFMFETIGNFDTGNDPFAGKQRKIVIEVVARVQRRFGLGPEAFRFHREMSPKSCPGTSLDKEEMLTAVRKIHGQLAASVKPGAGAFDLRASELRAMTERSISVLNVDPGAFPLVNESELDEGEMDSGQAAPCAGDVDAAARLDRARVGRSRSDRARGSRFP